MTFWPCLFPFRIFLYRMFRVSSSSTYGNCYTFNSGHHKEKATSFLPGPHLGLSLVMDLNQGLYLDNGLTTTAGIRVAIQDPNLRWNCTNVINRPVFITISSPLPDELGYDVQPASNTNFGVREAVTTRLKAPYTSNCYSNWTGTNYTNFLGK